MTGSPAESILGAWRLVSWQHADASGEVSYPYGPTPAEQIIYTANGQMSAQLIHREGDLAGATASGAREILGLAMQTYFAYYGTYTLDESAGTVTHHVLGCLAPSWIGSDQVRAFEFLNEDRLRLTAVVSAEDDVADVSGAIGPQALVWERIE